MLDLDPVYILLIGIGAGIVLTAIVILLVDFLYRKAFYMAEMRLASRMEAARKLELEKLDALDKSMGEKVKEKPKVETEVEQPVSDNHEPEQKAEVVAEIKEPRLGSVVYEYFVTGNPQPYDNLQDALRMFPAEVAKGTSAIWEELPGYVKENIRRELKS